MKSIISLISKLFVLPDTSGTVVDSSGNGHTGKLVGTVPPALIASPFGAGTALRFDGEDRDTLSAGVDCGATWCGVATADGSMRLKATIRRTRTGQSECIAAKFGTGTSTLNYGLYSDASDKLSFYLVNSTPTLIAAVGTTSLLADVNYDVEGEWTGTVIRVKVNGVAEGTTPAITALQAPDAVTSLTIGRDSQTTTGDGSPISFAGTIKNVELIVGGVTKALYNFQRNVPVEGTVTVANPTANPETGLAKDTTLTSGAQKTQITGPLRTSRVDVADTATEMEALADQSGSGSVLTFTFASAVQLVWVRSVGGVSRTVIGSQTPTATLGIYCADDEPAPITVNGTAVKVFAPNGTTVSVWGFRYS